MVPPPAAAGTTPRPRMPDLSNDDVDLIARAAARASEILIDKQRQFEQQQQSAVAPSGSTLAAMAAIVNLVIYTARNGSERTFTMIVYAVNAIILYVAYGRMTSPIGAPSRSAGNPRARAAAGKSARRTTGAEADEGQSPPPPASPRQPSFARTIIPAGRTIPRAAPAGGGDLDGRLRSCPPDSAAAVRAYASSAPSEVDVAPHSYGNADPGCFHLRVGPNYRKNRAKAPSGPALYDLLSVDFLYADAPLRSASDKFRIPRIPGITDVNTGHDHIPPMLIVNTWLPGEEPSMFARGGADGGDTYCIPMIFVLSSSTLEQLRDIDTASPGVRLLSEWCRRADNDPDFRGRFKCMGMIEDIESTGWVVLLITFGSDDIVFAMVRFISHPLSFLSFSHFHISVPKFIQGYNGKPALVTKSGTFTRRDNYIEYTINVNMWAYLAKKGLFALIPTFPDFIFNVGFTIEARNDEEMPGEIPLGCLSFFLPSFPTMMMCIVLTLFPILRHTSTEVLLGGCRLMNLDPDKVVVDGVDDLEICTSRSA